MLKSSSRKALLTSNVNLTDSDGKSLRLLGLAELIERAGCKVTLIVGECNSNQARRFSVIETHTPFRDTLGDNPLRKLRHFFRQFIWLLSFYAKLLILGVDCSVIVSSLAGLEIDSLLACMVSKVKKVPFIYDYDDPSPELRIAFFGCSDNDPRVRLSRFTRNILIQNAGLVLTAADSVKNQIIKDSEKTKAVHVWYNLPRMDDIHVTESKEYLRDKLRLEMKSFIVSYLGRVPSWGIEPLRNVLVNFAKYFGYDENVLFLIIGGGDRWEEYYRKLVKELGCSDRILVTGRKPREEALEYLMASDISCIPFASSLASNNIVPTKLFEAMALGIPVLCAESANYVKVLGDEGIYFNGSLTDLKEKIRWCLANPKKLEEISSSLKSRFVQEYSWDEKSFALENVLGVLLRSSTK